MGPVLMLQLCVLVPGASYLFGVGADSLPGNELVKMRVIEEEVETPTHWETVLHCAIEHPASSSQLCRSIWWSHFTDADDDEDDGDDDDVNNENVVNAGRDGNARKGSKRAPDKETATTSQNLPEGSDAYRINTEMLQLTSHLEILRAEESFRGRYSCNAMCGISTYTITCHVTDFLHQNRTFLCSEKTFNDVFKFTKERTVTLSTSPVTETFHDDKSPQSNNQPGNRLDVGKMKEVDQSKGNSGRPLTLLAPHVAVGIGVLVTCLLIILCVMWSRWYSKFKIASKGNRRGGIAESDSPFVEEQQQEQQEQRQQQHWQSELGSLLAERNRRDVLSRVSFSRNLLLEEGFHFSLSSPDASRRLRRSSLRPNGLSVSGLRYARALSGQRYTLFPLRRSDGLSAIAVWRQMAEDSVSIAMPQTSDLSFSGSDRAVRLPSYADAVAQSRHDHRNRADDNSRQLDGNRQPAEGEELQRLLLHGDEHQHCQLPICDLGQDHHRYHQLMIPPPPPYRSPKLSRHGAGVCVTSSSEGVHDTLPNDPEDRDTCDISRPPSYRSLDTEIDEITAVHFQNNPTPDTVDDFDSEENLQRGNEEESVGEDESETDDSMSEGSESSSADMEQTRYSRSRESRRVSRWRIGRPPPVYDDCV